MKMFRVCIAKRYMYDEYRAYNIYLVNADNMEIAISNIQKAIDNEHKKQYVNKYELFSIEEYKKAVI